MTENKRFEVKYQNMKFEPFQERVIFDNKCRNEFDSSLKSQDDLCGLMNELNDKNRKLNKFNQILMKANNELSEGVDYYKSKSASCEQGLIHNEKELHQYKQNVTEILQKAYDKSNEGLVYRLELAGSKYIGQQQRIAILKLLKDIAKDLGVELE